MTTLGFTTYPPRGVEEKQTTVADHWDFHPLGESIVRVFCFERLTIQAFEKKLSDPQFRILAT